MKKLLFTLGLIACVGMTANAQTTANATTQGTEVVKQEIGIAELPHTVQIAFRDEQADYNQIAGIWEISDGGQKLYKIKFAKDGQTWVLKYAADGGLLERNEKKEK
jgi:hypothetical protein